MRMKWCTPSVVVLIFCAEVQLQAQKQTGTIAPSPVQPNPSVVDTAAAQSTPSHDYFTVGSTKAEVVAVQGEPTESTAYYSTYGMSMVMLQGGKVVNWNNADVKLKARYLTATNLIPKEYFTVGSTRDEVLAIHGEPTSFSDYFLTYGMSMVMFQDGKVVNWNNVDVPLKARKPSGTDLTPNLQRQWLSPEPAAQRQPETSNLTPPRLPDSPPGVPANPAVQQPEQRSGTNLTLGLHQYRLGPDTAAPQQSPTSDLNRPQPPDSPLQGSALVNPAVRQPEQPQVHGIAYMDAFMGEKNFCIPSDNVISMKTEALKFQINGQTYDYSGHYAVMLITPRKHKNPSFGFGTPEKAKLVIIDDFGGETLPLPDATIWEKSSGFIVVEALDKEWIYSGTYTIQKYETPRKGVVRRLPTKEEIEYLRQQGVDVDKIAGQELEFDENWKGVPKPDQK